MRWNDDDPPDDAERARSSTIAGLHTGCAAAQGCENPFVLDPTLVRRAFFPRRLVVDVMLEGPFDPVAGTMQTNLWDAGLFPMEQPFSDPIYDGTPLDYDGDEVFTPPDPLSAPLTPVDWVLLEFRATPGGPAVHRRPAVLVAYGTLLDVNGLFRMDVSADAPSISGSFYVVVRHRNHAAAMVQTGFTSVGGDLWANLRAQVYGDGAAMLPSGQRALYAADAAADGQVTALDFNAFSAASAAFAAGYHPADFNLDGLVTALDFNLYSANSARLAASTVPEP